MVSYPVVHFLESLTSTSPLSIYSNSPLLSRESLIRLITVRSKLRSITFILSSRADNSVS